MTADESEALLQDGILASFDELGKESLDLHSFFEMLGANTAEEQAEVLAAIDHLVQRGLLRERGNDFYDRTDAGRAALGSGPRYA